MPVADPQIVLRRLEEFRRNLLDTSLRNRLINFKTRTKAGKPLEKVVEVRGEDPVELVRILVSEGKAMSFSGRPDPRPAKKAEGQLEIDDLGDESSLALFHEEAEHEMDAFLATGEEVVDTTDLKLNTRDTVTSLRRKLTSIYRDAKVAIEEQGVNVLFLALGSLEWYEADSSDEVRSAPLIMLPVTLERTNAGAFRLKWDGGDVGGNLSIAAKIKAEFGIRLPEIPDELDSAQYFGEVERSVEAQGRWSVDRTCVALGFFSYAKYLMYRDLDPAGWPEDGKPMDHETIGALLDGGFYESEPGVAEESFLDPLRPSSDVCEVYDADGSQTLAILEANTGRTMIIEGPPGTGKSQTITNLIAEAVGAGRKVLFVAEKAAALDVVYRRLREANLEDACLELHSNKANKRSFYGELKRTVAVASPKSARAEADLKRLEEAKATLNDYTADVNATLDPFGVSPRYAMGRLVAMGPEPSPDGRHDFAAMENWTETVFQERREVVRSLQAQVARMGRPVDHPYYGCTLDHLLPQDKEDIARRLAEAGQAAEAFHLSANALAEALRVELPVRPADVERLRACATFVAHAPDVNGVAIRADWEALEPGLRDALADGRRWTAIRDTTKVAPTAYDLDLHALRDLLRLAELEHADAAFELSDASRSLARELGIAEPRTLADMEPLAALARRLASAPDVRGLAAAAPEWKTSHLEVEEMLALVRRVQEAHARYDRMLSPAAWGASVESEADTLSKHGGSPLRVLNGAFRRAMAASAVHFTNPPASPLERAEALRAVGTAREAEAALSRHRGRMTTLFGERWLGARSDVGALTEVASWIQENVDKVPVSALNALERGTDPQALGMASDALRARALTDESAFEFLLGSLRPRLPEIRALIAEGSLKEVLTTLDRVAEAQALRANIAAAPPVLGPKWTSGSWDEAEGILDWVLGLRRAVQTHELPEGLIAFFAEERSRLGLNEAVGRAQDDRQKAHDAVKSVLLLAQLDRDPASFTESPISVQRERIAHWAERLDDLPALIRYNSLAAEATRLSLEESVALSNTWSEAGSRLAEAFERSWYVGIVRKAVHAHPSLAQFERRSHEETVETFKNLDDLSLRYNRAKVALAHWRAVPRGVAGGAMGWLGVQFGLRQNHKPIRLTMEKAGEAVQAIKPVFLMSPLSVAMYLPADGPRFDVVIFDEASQVKPEDAFGGILRARQTIVVGDSKQMPPTSFFDKLTSEEVDEEQDDGGGVTELESVLAMMSAKLPAKSPRRRDLRWHYRSRHDALIATSNRLFYDDRLVVFPSPWRGDANAGLVLRHDPTTVYGRGGSRKNVEEARAVARAAKRHVLEHPKLTLGIAAFSKAQQDAILDELDVLRRDEPAFAAFDSEHPFEPLFVKNLENVQGDERDVILISVGYGRDENGYIPASFGPLNRDGGERRLNVLITRARVRCEVFTNLKAGDMRLTENPSRGVLALRTFLAFADTGSLDVPAATGLEPQSPFEEAVLDRLRAHGYDVEPQVGSSGFYIDMAVRHPEQPQRFVLGIECDGAMYHSARTARDRDKLRQQVLESRGWRIHRIWSTDWFHNADKEFDRLVQAIAAATARTSEDIAEESARPSEYVELERDEETTVDEGVVPYVTCGIRIDLRGTPLHLVPSSQLADWVAQVVADEGPIHLDEATRRIREAAGVGQAGSRIRAAIESGSALAERQGRLVRRGDFLHDSAEKAVVVRSRAGLPSQAKRLEMVSPEEITEALTRVVRKSFGIEPEEAAVIAARSLGFDRTTSGMIGRLRELIDRVVEDGSFESDAGLLRIVKPAPVPSEEGQTLPSQG